MQSLNMDFNPKRLERYLTLAWQSGATPVILLTKADLVEDYWEYLTQVERVAAGVNTHVVSAHTGYGLERLNAYLQPGKTVVFLGSSGVGKSSLVNALAGEEIMSVSAIREDDSKGRHTTTHRQLIRLKSGVMIIDTPVCGNWVCGMYRKGWEMPLLMWNSLSGNAASQTASMKQNPAAPSKPPLPPVNWMLPDGKATES